MNINHFHIGTKNLKNSVDFYCGFFGFTKKFDHDPGIFLENQNGFLLAIDPVSEVPSLPSWFHFGFCLNSEAEVLKIYNLVKEKKVPIARDLLAKDGQFASFYIFDPDGYKIEVSWHNE